MRKNAPPGTWKLENRLGPVPQQWLWVDQLPTHVDLEVEMATHANRVSGLPHHTYSLTRVYALTLMSQRHPRHVGVEVRTPLPFAVDQQIVAVEHRVIADAQYSTAANGHQRRAAGGDDVKALVDAAATARSTELTDVAAGTVRALDRKDVVVVSEAAVG